MVAAAKIGWVSRNYFTTKRKFFYLAILVLSILLAAGDLMAAILLCLPLFALYEAGILVIRLFTSEKEDDTSDADEVDDNE